MKPQSEYTLPDAPCFINVNNADEYDTLVAAVNAYVAAFGLPQVKWRSGKEIEKHAFTSIYWLHLSTQTMDGWPVFEYLTQHDKTWPEINCPDMPRFTLSEYCDKLNLINEDAADILSGLL